MERARLFETVIRRAGALARLALSRQTDPVRISDTTRMLRTLTPPAIAVATILTALTRAGGDGGLAVAGLVTVVGPCVGALLMFSRMADPGGRTAMLLHVALAIVLGLGWSMLTSALSAPGGGAVLAACLQVALVSVGVVLYAGLPVAFAAFSLGPLASLFRHLTQAGNPPAMTAALIAGYLGIMLMSLLERGRVARAGREAARRLGVVEADRLRAENAMSEELVRRREQERLAIADAERQAAEQAARVRRD
ncbi:MAG TPA: hypothetical protein VF636_05960, partial [Sphingomonas sp.]